MKPALLMLLGRLLASMPMRLRKLIADALTQCLVRLPNRRRVRADDNIRRCLGLDQASHRQLVQRHLQHRADGLLELGALWYWPLPRLLQLITEVHGWDQLIRAAEPGHGVIVTVPHFGSWELASLYLAQHLADTALLYKPLSELRVEQMISGYRARAGAQVLPANRSGIAAMIRLLQRGGYGGILPDQTPPAQAGQVAMLFGRPALSMTLLLRLARKTGASVVFVGCRRLPDRTHFALHVQTAPAQLYAAEDALALRAMNQGIEAIAALDLAQYQWSYNRYRQAAT
jgi:KDO2-lipid IV(A) lauroyltransferase